MSTRNSETEYSASLDSSDTSDRTYMYAKFNVRDRSGRYEEVEIGGEGPTGLEIALDGFMESCVKDGKHIDPDTAHMGLSIKEYPNTLYSSDNEGYGLQDFKTPNETSALNMSGGAAADLANILIKVGDFWKVHEHDFRKFWFDLCFEARRNFLRVVCPQMPESTTNPTFTLNGVQENVEGSATLMPYITVDVLKRGNALPSFIQEEIQDPFLEHIRSAIYSLRQLTLEGKVNYDIQKIQNHENGIQTHYHVFSSDPPYQYEAKVPHREVKGGKRAVLAWQNANMSALMEADMACTDYEFDHVKSMVSLQIIFLANIVDEFRTKVLKKTDFPKTMEPMMRCLQCGAAKKKLLICSRCKAARYCSAACQKSHWKRHKPNCPKK